VAHFFFYRRYFGYGGGKALLVSFATLFFTIGCVAWRYFSIEHLSDTIGTPEPAILPLISLGLLVPIAIPFLLKLHSKWIGGQLTESEKAPGGDRQYCFYPPDRHPLLAGTRCLLLCHDGDPARSADRLSALKFARTDSRRTSTTTE